MALGYAWKHADPNDFEFLCLEEMDVTDSLRCRFLESWWIKTLRNLGVGIYNGQLPMR